MLWRMLLQNWIRQKAQEQAMAAVQQAMQQQAAAGEQGEPPPPCDVGLVCALSMEAGGLVDRLSDATTSRGGAYRFRLGNCHGRAVAMVESGVGEAAAADAVELLIAAHRPACIIATGFAGGLDARLARNDVLMADSLAHHSGGQLKLDLKLSAESAARTPGLHVGRLLTVEQIVARPDDKRALGEAHGALAVDMETWGVAQVCRQHKVPLMAVRVISDALDDQLPGDLEKLARARGIPQQMGAVTGTLWRRPSAVKDMWALKERALVASERLGKFLASVIEQLPKRPPAQGEAN